VAGLVKLDSSGWSTSDRYTLVLAMDILVPTSVIGSFVGITAIVPRWLTRALSSLSACDGDVPSGLVASGAVNGVQPFAGSTNLPSSGSSLPLVSTVAPAMAALLAAVACAVWPLALIRYWLTTLSLWSWSTTPKSRTVRHGLPSLAVPAAGIFRVPFAICAF